jgi:EH domain-containing protein 1
MDMLSITSANYSKQDEPLYKRWFEFADTDADGRLTGPDAVKFFSLSQLPRADLKQVCLWEGFSFPWHAKIILEFFCCIQ